MQIGFNAASLGSVGLFFFHSLSNVLQLQSVHTEKFAFVRLGYGCLFNSDLGSISVHKVSDESVSPVVIWSGIAIKLSCL